MEYVGSHVDLFLPKEVNNDDCEKIAKTLDIIIKPEEFFLFKKYINKKVLNYPKVYQGPQLSCDISEEEWNKYKTSSISTKKDF
jgi:hypothetical protein